MDVQKLVRDFFWEFDRERLTDAEAAEHTKNFMENYFQPDKLHPAWGFTPILALQSWLDEYCREVLGWSDPREGEDA